MTEHPLSAVIVNPAAQKGGAASRWSQIRTELIARLGTFEPRFTKAPGHATELARGALGEGARRIVAVGGHGSVYRALRRRRSSARWPSAARRGREHHGWRGPGDASYLHCPGRKLREWRRRQKAEASREVRRWRARSDREG